MKPARFRYLRPATLDAALALLGEHGSDATILAGGQSLVPMMNLRFARPGAVIDIKRIRELERIDADGKRLAIGALARHADVLQSNLVATHAPLIRRALPHVAHAAIRNRGTFGGSLALADPAAELPACAVCLDAEIVVASAAGERRIPAASFFRGTYTTALADGEMIVRIELPLFDAAWRWHFDEVSRRHGDFAIAGLAFGIREEDGKIGACRVVFCGVEEAPRRVHDVEAMIAASGRVPGAIEAAIQVLQTALQPVESRDYPPAYRSQVAATLLRRALARDEVAA